MASTTNETLTATQRFWMLLKPDRAEISNIYVYAVFKGLVNLSLPLGIQAIVNLIQGGSINSSWMVLVLFVVLGLGMTGGLHMFQMRITENLQQRIYSRAAFDFAYRIPKIRMEALYHHYAPELMNRFFDTISLQKGLTKILIEFSSASLYVIFGLLLLSLYHPFFIIYSVILLGLVYLIYRLTAHRGLKTSLAESKHKYRMAHWLEELARASATFKLAGRTNLPLSRTDDHLGDYLNARESHFKVLIGQYGIMVFFQVLIATGLLAVGGILVMNQKMNIGQFVAAEIIILSVLASVEKLVLCIETVYDILTALEKMGQVTDLPIEREEGAELDIAPTGKGLEIEALAVSFMYPDLETPTIRNLDLTIASGECVMICGENGSGKSTLLNIFAGIYEVQEGSMAYNGLAKGNLNLSSIRTATGDCLSQEELFQGTLLENILIGRPNAQEADALWAMKNVFLQEWVKTLPQGYNTVIAPQGRRLPRSIVQRILLARAIVCKPALILLEDTFEHLDRGHRESIIDFLTHPDRTWTLVAVSNDAYLAKCSDRILVMKDGQVVRSGKYDEVGELYTN